ncbi:sodium:solute symporter family protein [Parasulfuritortus cantonensis]|uniref:Sodium:solute symporter family protein n=1 Tax=Parasulfuritortus cantonensis TaxID=2528202 RepID=A0A4V2NWW3_9PROT|nr:sodium:solute symporter family protein [Parasulfuritortus cantonensis]TCJ18942.1 sodium:solute symporter family protein [Parasulfuritortus cantonensis]
MSPHTTVDLVDTLVILIYLGAIGYLGWLGWKGTRTASDFLLAGRGAHPVVMAISYGATFISTSAIVGFGGVAGMFGMSLLWLTFLNIAVGIFVAFVVLGEPTRRIGHHLGAHTFPELLGLRYQSKGIQVFAGALLFLFMPLYIAAVMTGGAVFAASQFGIDFEVALLIFSLLTAAYVIPGGLKAVMYTDTLQGVIMIFGMAFLLWFTYDSLGGVGDAHRALTDMADLVPKPLADIGHRGWTAMPAFGWGAKSYDLWWTVVTSIMIGVGIGVLAQPQLIVRFMTVRSRRELDRAVPAGALFILLMVGTPYVVGSLSNVWFARNGPLLSGRVVQTLDAGRGHALVELVRENDAGRWQAVLDGKTGKPVKAPLVVSARQPAVDADGHPFERVSGRSIALVYGKGQADQIMPAYITSALPHWFGLLFFLTLLSAAMSTLSSQFHTLGTAAGRDLWEQLTGKPGGSQPSLKVIRLAILAGLLVSVALAYTVRDEYVIARFTAIFFGLCAATFMPAYIGGLFSRRITRAGAVASMVVGLAASLFWLLFMKAKEAGALGLVKWLTGGHSSLVEDLPNWPVVDAIVVALPLSILTAILVSAVTRPPDAAHLARCFPERRA